MLQLFIFGTPISLTMSFSAQFTAAQSATGTLTIIDESDYSLEGKSSFSNRVLKIYYSDGSLYTGAPIPFSLQSFPSDQVSITGIERDFAFTVELTLVPTAAQNGSTYTIQKVVGAIAFSMQFLYRLAKEIAANPSIANKANYYSNLQEVYTEQQNAVNAVTYNDVWSAQRALDRVNHFIKNKTLYF